MKIKTYVVQDEQGVVVAVKLTYHAAHQIARAQAPCKVTMFVADKRDDLDMEVPLGSSYVPAEL